MSNNSRNAFSYYDYHILCFLGISVCFEISYEGKTLCWLRRCNDVLKES